ncbi:SGNH/GDSL hydrolase family protein [uncultured Marinobacter sp.]|uniref:SGNH/GDSL hydrolase family protein n=1 Tax=uncultured Marinobacter sp. TaxID=187379 RepID=UPI0025FE6F40|nr:SGNH/GDSL hydrolase family protein [uncultured Marinobacter sp.]
MRFSTVVLWVFASTFMLSACGGGGSGDSTSELEKVDDSERGGQESTSIGLKLDFDTPAELVADLGQFLIESASENNIRFDSSEGNICDPTLYDRKVDNFNFDSLYRVTVNNRDYFFRHGWQRCGDESSELLYVNWANGSVAPPGQWEVSVVQKDIDQDGTSTLVTVGDSITWWGHGQSLRARLDRLKPSFIFTGSRTDGYGYGHDGEGGDNTEKVIDRLDGIPAADYYLLHIGTNDRGDIEETKDNIKFIASSLLQKQSNSVVYLATILPRSDEIDARNASVNSELRSWSQTQPNVMLVDLESEFRAVANWESYLPDGIHPNAEGYKIIAQILSERL